MALRHKKTFLVSGLLCSLLFAVLLLVRTGIVSRPVDPASIAPVMPAGPLGQSERWMAILQGNRRIGTTHSRLEPTEDGYRLTETVSMRINTMGMTQNISLNTESRLNPDFTLQAVDFEISSGRFRFSVKGTVDGNSLQVTTRSAGASRQLEIQINENYI